MNYSHRIVKGTCANCQIHTAYLGETECSVLLRSRLLELDGMTKLREEELVAHDAGLLSARSAEEAALPADPALSVAWERGRALGQAQQAMTDKVELDKQLAQLQGEHKKLLVHCAALRAEDVVKELAETQRKLAALRKTVEGLSKPGSPAYLRLRWQEDREEMLELRRRVKELEAEVKKLTTKAHPKRKKSA